MIYAFLADGFEDVEALGVIDVCRRAGLEVNTVSIMPTEVVESAHGVRVVADSMLADNDYTGAEMLFLPGGMPGAQHLKGIHPQAGGLEHPDHHPAEQHPDDGHAHAPPHPGGADLIEIRSDSIHDKITRASIAQSGRLSMRFAPAQKDRDRPNGRSRQFPARYVPSNARPV